MAGATALVSARATGVFTEGHQRFWDTARRKAGEDRDGTKALIGVLLLHRTLPTEAVLAGIDAAVAPPAGTIPTWSPSRCPSTPGQWTARRDGSRTCPAGGWGSMTGRYRWTGTTTCCSPGHDGAGARFRYTLANFVSLSVAVVVGRGAP